MKRRHGDRSRHQRAPYAADPAHEPRPAACRAAEPDPQRVPARLRPHHPFHRVPAAGAQDPGLRLPRGRPLPHPADPHARSRPDRPLAGARARPRRGPRRGAGARPRPRPSAVRPCRRARARRLPRRASAASTTTRRRLRIVTDAGAALRRLRRPQSDLGNARRPGQAQRPADRPRRRADRPLRRARRAGGDPRLSRERRISSCGAIASAEAQAAAIADDIAYDAHDIDDGLRAELFALDDLASVPLVGDIVREIDARYPASSRRAAPTSWCAG